MTRRTKKRVHAALGITVVAASCMVIVSGASGFPTFANQWQAIYPASMSDDLINRATGRTCQLCHSDPNGGNGWNAYGWEQFIQINDLGNSFADAIANIEASDSDQDPGANSNLTEINADTQPGWTEGPNNTVFFSDGGTISNVSPPDAEADPALAACDGDANGDGAVDVNDISYVIFRLGQCNTGGTPCLNGCDGDANGDATVDVNDISYVIFRLSQCNPQSFTCP